MRGLAAKGVGRRSAGGILSRATMSYEAFVVGNVGTISSIESSLRSLTWFLPGRFKDAELASEARQSLLSHLTPPPLILFLQFQLSSMSSASTTTHSLLKS